MIDSPSGWIATFPPSTRWSGMTEMLSRPARVRGESPALLAAIVVFLEVICIPSVIDFLEPGPESGGSFASSASLARSASYCSRPPETGAYPGV